MREEFSKFSLGKSYNISNASLAICVTTFQILDMLLWQKRVFNWLYSLGLTVLNWVFMANTMLIQVTNQKALALLHELEELNLIRVLREHTGPIKTKLSEKYKGSLSKEQGKSLNEHIASIRTEWKNI